MNIKKEILKIIIILGILLVTDYVLKMIFALVFLIYPKISPYSSDVNLAIDIAVTIAGGIILIRFTQGILSSLVYAKLEKGIAGILKFVMDLILYTILVLVVLAALHVNLSSVLFGGAIGGIILGLAVQTIVQNLLSGVLVTSSRTIKPGDAVSLNSWIWGNTPLVGEVVNVSLLYTEVKSINGDVFRVPNSVFLSNTLFQKLTSESSLIYPLQVTLNADVSASKVLEKVNELLDEDLKKKVKIYLYSKNGSTNIFTVIITFNQVDELRELINKINIAFDKAYWSLK